MLHVFYFPLPDSTLLHTALCSWKLRYTETLQPFTGFGPQWPPSGDGRGKEWSWAQLSTTTGRNPLQLLSSGSAKLISPVSITTSSPHAFRPRSAKGSLLQLPLGTALCPAGSQNPASTLVSSLFTDRPSITQCENISSYLPRPRLIQRTFKTKGTLMIYLNVSLYKSRNWVISSSHWI